MIEKMIRNELTLKRWRRFKSKPMAVWSGNILLVMLFLTFISPCISNDKPVMMKYNGEYYFPVLTSYHPTEFGIHDRLVVNYKKLELSDSDYAVWPPIPWHPNESNLEVESYPAPPSEINYLGTDNRGRDVFTRLLYGFKYSIGYAVSVWGLTFVIGTILGGIMGYVGGRVDFYGQRIVEVMSTVPQLLLLLTLISIFKPSMTLLIVVSSIFAWIPISYYVRGEFLRNRKREYVEAARSMGATHTNIIFRHVLPNSLTSVITFAPFNISMNIIILSSLDYLGFGLEVPTPSWGELLNQAQTYATTAWWLAVFPSMALFVTLTLLNLLGQGVRDALDPNLT